MQELAKGLERDQTRTSMPADSSQMGGEGKSKARNNKSKKETRRKHKENGASEASDSWVMRFDFGLPTGEKEKHRIITRRWF